jgi:hypothetical protein
MYMLCFIKWKGRNACLKFNLFGIAKGYLQVWNKNALQWRNVWSLNKKERTILEKGQTGVLQLKDSILASNLRLLYKKVETTNKYVNIGELSEAQLVGFLVVDLPTRAPSTARRLWWFCQSWDLPIQFSSLGVRMCVRRVSVRLCMWTSASITGSRKKKYVIYCLHCRNR